MAVSVLTYGDNFEFPKYSKQQLDDFQNTILKKYNLTFPDFFLQAYLEGAKSLNEIFFCEN
jgi:hypothetical protein